MATKPTVSQVATGSKATATQWNNAVYQQWQFLDIVKPLCVVSPSAVQSIPNNTFTALTFDTEVIDTDSQHSISTNTSRVVIGTTLGWYRCSGGVVFAGAAAASRYGAEVALNGVAVNGSQQFIASSGTATPLSAILIPTFVQATLSTDYVEMLVLQNAGVAMNTTVSGAARPIFCVEYVGTLQ